MRKYALPVLAMLLAAAAPAALRYAVDTPRSEVTAKVAFLGLASKTARFPKMMGVASLAGRDPETLALDVTIDASALEAPDEVTLKRLRGERFFWVEKYPTVRFVGQGMAMKDAVSGTVAGKLTARGVTRPVTLAVRFATNPRQAAAGAQLAITGETTIDRRDFGMTAYPLIVGRKVAIRISAVVVPQ